ncbi:MAG: hypothetical protein ACQEXE_18915 [Bacillota bacterium]|jgi:low affinity Fe/Cu permease|uniref:hypothetical protein n=1 Tax=Cytobacillus TaxID=2675230 RepID=UPI0018CDDB6B|nr:MULTISPECIES: hypothetical protein [Cytobacillus]MBG9446204.1 hypothetical protein [Cytobacillus firmus]MBG9587521.1 hypothetical protein [Cytobacillus firmus]MCC3649095.1 hypothetical protein [Cytobacillus oceanisediminis]MCU1807900.1 hypothetical protein [Cytobacillus firmus]
MTSTALFIIAMASIVIWISLSKELMKPSKEQNGRKIVILTAAGSLSTLVLTIPLFQNISF